MSEVPAQKASVLHFAHNLLVGASQAVAQKGEGAGYWQAYDCAPEDPKSEFEVTELRLDPVSARRVIEARINEGFDGMLGFCVFQLSLLRLYVEAFDARSAEVRGKRAAKIEMVLPPKRSWMGKLRPASNPEIIA